MKNTRIRIKRQVVFQQSHSATEDLKHQLNLKKKHIDFPDDQFRNKGEAKKDTLPVE